MATFTSESVTEGHPDKVCDQISDAILDAALRQDPQSRVALETLAAADGIVLAGELTTKAKLNYEKIVRETIRAIGYSRENGYDPDTIKIDVHVHEQSPEIAQGVDEDSEHAHEQGAGDQGFMIGYACDETPELMPLTIMLSHQLTRKLSAVRKDGTLAWLRPDGKALVTVEYEGRGTQRTAKRIATVVIAAQHNPGVEEETVREEIIKEVIEPICGDLLDDQTQITVNGTGSFVLGGPAADAGLTGRKIIVDTYGGRGRHGGGAFSGKDATKVDRSAAYMARHIAKNIVAAKLATECEVRLSYCIGIAEPVAVDVQSFDTGIVDDELLATAVRAVFSLKPREIIEYLGLRKPIFQITAAYGHFGRDPDEENIEGAFSWERIDRVEELQEAIKD